MSRRRKKRVLVITNPVNADDPMAGTNPLGTERELRDAAARFNTLPDGSDTARAGTVILYGPGFTLEYAVGHATLSQAMVVVHDTDFAWPVLSRLCKDRGWKMQDTESGQYFG